METIRRKLKARDLMIAVVAFALALKLGMAYSRSPGYWREARFQGEAANSFRFYAACFENGSTSMIREKPGERQQAAVKAREFATKLDLQRSMYLRAAFLPWLPTAPELPAI